AAGAADRARRARCPRQGRRRLIAAALDSGAIATILRSHPSVPAAPGQWVSRTRIIPKGRDMAIKVGDKIPSETLSHKTADGVQKVTTDDLFKNKTVVLFGLPGAFTPTCSAKHLPGFVQHAKEIKAKGVDTIACLSVNDAFVMDAWGKDQKVGDHVLMLA